MGYPPPSSSYARDPLGWKAGWAGLIAVRRGGPVEDRNPRLEMPPGRPGPSGRIAVATTELGA